jgi:hypothetical protein
MTPEERTQLLPHIPQGIKTQWRELTGDGGKRFVALKARPCPFHIFNECVVYEHRPYNCRRFSCLRVNPKEEPLQYNNTGGCRNLLDRLETSRAARRLYAKIQRKAQRWAVRFGWS